MHCQENTTASTMFREDRFAIIKAGKIFSCLCALIPIIGMIMLIFVCIAKKKR